ncbi:MAG: hypothetical protein U0P81_15335 [Holophagaceae bacterium]
MRLSILPAATLLALATACGSGSLSTSTAAKLIAPDYPAIAPLRVPRTFTVEKGTPRFADIQLIHAALQQEGSVDIQAKEEGAKVTYSYSLSPKAAKGSKPTADGFHVPAAYVEFVKVLGVETRGSQARATYQVKLTRPTPLFPIFQKKHPGAQIGQTKVRTAKFDKQDGKWGLLETDEKLDIKE